ncbi:MAG: SufE family protein [Oligoflexia bacterium]|nr:SufE family protein [Oligoflexia bacterium]
MSQSLEELVSEFKQFATWEDRYKHLIAMGKSLAPMNEDYRIEDNKVRGCQSQVWLFPELVDGKLVFHADSDAAIVKGIVALLVKIYSDKTPDEILATKPDFIEEIGLAQHLSMSRANGLSSMLKQISMYALAFKTKIEMGIQ